MQRASWLAVFAAVTVMAAPAAAGRVPRVALTVSVAGYGSVVSHPAGIVCPGRCRAMFRAGTRITLVARPDPGSAAVGWRPGCGTRMVCRLTLRTSRRVGAVFSPMKTLTAAGPIWRLAADGGRIVADVCNHLFVWTPATGEVTLLEPMTKPCPYPGPPQRDYDLALAGDRVLALGGSFAISAIFEMRGYRLDGAAFSLLQGLPSVDVYYSGHGSPVTGALGNLTGAGSLLVFNSWDETGPLGNACCTVVSERILRVGPHGCPCTVIETQPGPIVPFDVDRGRILAGGDNAVLLLDADGHQLLSIPVHATWGALSADDVVLLVGGELRGYSATTGALLHAWPFTASAKGGPCFGPGWNCSPPALDAKDGLVAYVADEGLRPAGAWFGGGRGHVHLLRLSDGSDVTVAPATFAGVVDTGLVYADGSTIHVVPLAKLPLSA